MRAVVLRDEHREYIGGGGRTGVAGAAARPTVGVVVTAYRRTEFLARALGSIAQGTEPPDRVVVVEDNPPYATGARSLLDRLFPALPHEDVNGPIPAFGELIATGLEHCGTDVVAFLEDDDLFLPGKVAYLRSLFAAHPELGYVRHSFQGIDTELVPIPMRRGILAVPRGPVAPEPRAWDRARIYGNCSSIALRRPPVVPYLPSVRGLGASLDMALFWLALRADLTPYCEPTVLTHKVIHLDSSSWKPYIYARQRKSLEELRDASRPGGAEGRFAQHMADRLPRGTTPGREAPRPRDASLRLLAALQRRLPPRPASWLRRGSLMLVLAFTW
jgi:glycosyltransferase involved in cell wall biosynthesis